MIFLAKALRIEADVPELLAVGEVLIRLSQIESILLLNKKVR